MSSMEAVPGCSNVQDTIANINQMKRISEALEANAGLGPPPKRRKVSMAESIYNHRRNESYTDIVTFTTGLVMDLLRKTVKCMKCLEACLTIVTDDSPNKKNRGRYFVPSRTVYEICSTTERHIQRRRMLDRKGAYDDTICMQLFAVATAHEFYDKAHLMFPELEEHFKEVPTRKQEEHNDFALINTIVKAYSKFRFFLISQEISHGAEIHHDLNKLVLFDH